MYSSQRATQRVETCTWHTNTCKDILYANDDCVLLITGPNLAEPAPSQLAHSYLVEYAMCIAD